MPIYDFSDPEWTDARIAEEIATVSQLPKGDERAGRLSPLVLERGRRKFRREKAQWAKEHDGEDALGRTRAPKRRGKPRARTESRLAPLGPYAPVPRAIAKDPSVPLAAKGFAAVIADLINLGKWNADLHVEITYRELAERTGANRETLMSHAAKLRKAGYLVTESRNRGGVRFRFTDHRSEKPA